MRICDERLPKVWGETYIMIGKESSIAKSESHRKKKKVTYADIGLESNSLMYE